MKTAQVTLFIIIGIVFLLAVSMAIYVFSSESMGGGERGVERAAVRQELIKPVQKYVSDCLELVSAMSLETLGAQGGFITLSQGGVSADILDSQERVRFLRTPEGENITYLITMQPETMLLLGGKPFISNSFTAEQHAQLVYPWMSFPFNVLQNNAPQFSMSSAFGWNRIPPLFRGQAPESWQATLESYVAANMPQCVDWQLLADKRLINASENPAVRVRFGQSDTSFEMDWSVMVADKATGATATLKEFVAVHPVRLSAVHSRLRAMLDKDVSEALYNLKKEPHVQVKQVTYKGKTQGTIVTYADPASQILGRQFVFRFARQNRPPALLLADQAMLDGSPVDSCVGATIRFVQRGTRACPQDEARLGVAGCQTPSGPAQEPPCAGNESLPCEGIAIAEDLAQDRTGFAITITGGATPIGEPCHLDITLPLFAIDPDENPVTFQFDPDVARGYALTQAVLSQPCIGIKVAATDGYAQDWQVLRLWTRTRDESACVFY